MKRRSILQIIAAFLAAFFGKFTRLERRGQPELAARPRPTGPRGIVSPKAQWVSPPTYEAVSSVSEKTRGSYQRVYETPDNEGFVSGMRLEPQEGYEVMRLRNPAVRYHLMAKGPLEHPAPTPVQPSGPVAKANGVSWQPLETFQPLKTHPELPAFGVVLGDLHRPAKAARFDISNDREFATAVGRPYRPRAYDPPTTEVLSPEEELAATQRWAKVDANYEELLANWDSQHFNPMDVAVAQENCKPLHEAWASRYPWGVIKS